MPTESDGETPFSIPVKISTTYDIQTPVAVEICHQLLEWLGARGWTIEPGNPVLHPADYDAGYREISEKFIDDWKHWTRR